MIKCIAKEHKAVPQVSVEPAPLSQVCTVPLSQLHCSHTRVVGVGECPAKIFDIQICLILKHGRLFEAFEHMRDKYKTFH